MKASRGSAAGSWSPTDAAVLVQLAQAAMGDLAAAFIPVPAGWSVVQLIPVSPTTPLAARSPQGFFAQGTLSAGQAVVLALALPWSAYLNFFFDGRLTPSQLPPDIVPTRSPMFDTKFWTMYEAARAAIWAQWAQLVKQTPSPPPLTVVGLGLGGPLAQLAAVDLRPGNTGPNGEAPPAAAAACYAFSSPAPAGAGFATLFANTASSSATVSLQTSLLTPVDLFPSDPGPYLPAGVAQPLTTLIPLPDDPWVERSPDFYLSALGGTPSPPSPTTGSLNPPSPPGFDPNLVGTLAQLCAFVYQQRQHPGSGSPLPAGYSFNTVVKAAGNALAAVFTAAKSVVVAFTGTTTFVEFATQLASSLPANASFFPPTASVHGGALALYTAPMSGTGSTTVQAQILAALKPLCPPGTSLYFTGHDLGGALAVIAAADIATNAGPALGTPAIATYTFGSSPPGTVNFANVIAKLWPTGVGGPYMIARPGDFLPSAALSGNYAPLGVPMSLDGVPPNDEVSGHALAGYAALLSQSVQALSPAQLRRAPRAKRRR